MSDSATDTYKLKREIIHFSAPERKFHADMTYGIVASQSCLLTRISQRLEEDTKKRYTVDRLSDHLAKGLPDEALEAYVGHVRKITPDEPVIHIDDSESGIQFSDFRL